MKSTTVGEQIQSIRPAVVDRTLARSLPPEHRSILADLLVHHTLDRVVEWSETQSDRRLFAWIDSVIRERSIEHVLFPLFSSTVSATLDALNEVTDVSPSVRGRLGLLQQQIDLHVGAFAVKSNRSAVHAVDSVDGKIDELIYRLSAQDALTAEHSRSVAMWCSRIAKRLSMTRAEVTLVTRSGLVHDVGKIATPLDILTAPRSLTSEEWEIMKRHTMEGVRIIGAHSELRELTPAVRSHHERYDGMGYPDCLSATDIPLAARIVAVADAFNAMIARRPYRAPLSPSIGIHELKVNRGTQFDPAIVDAMLDVVLQPDV